MRRAAPSRSAVGWLVLFCLLLGLVVVAHPTVYEPDTIGEVPGQAGSWYKSSVYGVGFNRSYTVVVHSVAFTFICAYSHPSILDVPILLFFSVRFADGETELLNASIGGFTRVEPRVELSAHDDPRAVVVSAFDTDHWYQWYYAVSA